MKVRLVKLFSGDLRPAYDDDKEKLKKLKPNQVVEIDLKVKRNYKHLQKFMVLINLVFENQEVYSNKEDLRHDLLVECGYYVEVINAFSGEVRRVARSISFAKMEQHDFDKLYNDVLMKICDLMNWNNTDLEQEVAQFI